MKEKKGRDGFGPSFKIKGGTIMAGENPSTKIPVPAVIREAHRLSIRQLAREIGVEPSTVEKWERLGFHPHPRHLARLVCGLGGPMPPEHAQPGDKPPSESALPGPDAHVCSTGAARSVPSGARRRPLAWIGPVGCSHSSGKYRRRTDHGAGA